MAITYVGSASAIAAGSSTTGITIPLNSGLGGGSGTGVATGDLVVVSLAFGSVIDHAMSLVTSGYTEIADLYANDTYDTNLAVYYKFVTAGVDTSVVSTSPADSQYAQAMTVHVFRGAKTTSGITIVPATGINSGQPIVPNISTGANSVVIHIGAYADSGSSVILDSTGLLDVLSVASPDTRAVSLLSGYKFVTTAGTATGQTLTNSITNTSQSWAAAAVAILPQINALTSTAITTGNPTLDTPTAADVSSGPIDLTATDTTTASPTLDTATLVATSILEAGGITTGSPTLDTSTVAQTHVITSVDITSGTPVLDASTLTQIAGTDILTSVGITTGAATLDTSDLSQKHILSAATIVTGAPTTGTTTLAQEHTLSSTNITTGVVSTGTPTLSRIINFTATNVDTGIPELDTPSASVVSNLVATFVTAGIPTLAAATVGQGHALTSTSITAAAPVLTSATAFSQESFSESYERKRTVWVLADNRVVVVSKDVLPNVVTAERENRTTTIQ